MRYLIAALTSALVLSGISTAPSPASAQEQTRPPLTDMSEADRLKLRTEIRAYLLENPEVLMEAIQVLEDRRKSEGMAADATTVKQYSDAIFNDGFSWVGGNPEGDVTLVEFSDYRCGYCKRAFPDLQRLVAADPNIRLVVKEFPILGPDSTTAARIAMAALTIDPALYPKLHDAMMSFDGPLSEPIAYQIAAHVGFDIPSLKKGVADPAIDQKIAKTYELAKALGLQGTPSFVIGDRIMRGYIDFDAMQGAVAAAREAIN